MLVTDGDVSVECVGEHATEAGARALLTVFQQNRLKGAEREPLDITRDGITQYLVTFARTH